MQLFIKNCAKCQHSSYKIERFNIKPLHTCVGNTRQMIPSHTNKLFLTLSTIFHIFGSSLTKASVYCKQTFIVETIP